jgi:4-amino-4-deoxy-L-arabinose transferase-like glycosyltransferase
VGSSFLSRTANSLDSTYPARGLPARRTLDNLAWALGALALGWLAQGLFAREDLLPGLLLYVVAIPIFAVQLTRSAARRALRETAERDQALPTLLSHLKIAPGLQGRVSIGLASGALILSLISLRLFTLETQNGSAWSLYVASLLMFVAGLWLADLPSFPPTKLSSFHLSLPNFFLLTIFLLAIFFRLFHFFSLPFGTWFDEAEAGIQVRRILQDPAFRPVFWEPLNLPTHLLYLFALSSRLFGVNTPALRVIPVLFGLGGVFFAYLFGREWKGQRWGLLLAFVVATMRWHVNFSRIAMTGIDTPFFEFATLYFALRALRTGRMWPIAWAGLSLGLGLCFYGAFRLFVAALILFVVGWGLKARGWRVVRRSPLSSQPLVPPGRPQLALRLGLLLVAIWLAGMPIAQFAWYHGDVFWRRTRAVSIFENRDEPNLGLALLQNTQKHLLMFNYKGDNNGRHNLPGAPTLDRLSAVLFAMGLGLAIAKLVSRRITDSASPQSMELTHLQIADSLNQFFLLLLPVGLAGGIFALDFEAPQSLRSIAALPAVAYFIALSLDTLWLELKWVARLVRPRLSLIPVVLCLGIIAVGNGDTYFGRQAHDFAVWQAFSTAETLVGKRMAEMGPDPIYYLSPFFIDHPSIRFHAPAEESPRSLRKVMPLPDPLPAREPPDRPVVYFIHPDEAWVFDLARQMYLSGWFEAMPADSEFPPAVFMVRLEPGDVASVQGLDVRYWAGDDWEGTGVPVATDRSPVLDVTWPAAAPLDLPFVAEWNGVLYAPKYGHYVLTVDAPDRVALTLDGVTVDGEGTLSLTPTLAQGNHSLRLRAEGGVGRVRLSWQFPGGGLQTSTGDAGVVPQWALYSFPVSGHGLLGKYYANPDWQGEPALERVDPVLNVYFHLTPLPRPYSVEWTGALDVPYGGAYALGLRSVDEARLYLDGQLVVEATTPDEYVESLVTLETGLHDLRITYQDQTGRSRIHLYWTRPGGEKEIIPTQYLWPSRAAKSSQSAAPASGPSTGPPSPTEAQFQKMDLIWQATWGGPGDAEGQFREPRDVAVIGDTVFVADTGNRRVQAFGRDGTFRKAVSGGQEPFEEPLALGVDSQSHLLVLDSLPGWIYRFSPGDLQANTAGRSLDRFAGPSSQTFHPRGMTVLPDDTIIVADTGGARLVFFGPAGNMAGRLGALGSAPGQLSEPTDVAVDAAGTYYVTEAPNRRVQHLDRWGNSLGEWPIQPSVAYDGPHMAWAPDGSLLMTAPAESAILRYAPDGRLLNRWTQAGTTLLRQPVGIYVDAATSTLYVTDTATHQVYLFRIES